MAKPDISDLHVDKLLTNMSIGYVQEQDAYIALRAVPVVPVQKQTDKIAEYNQGDWLRDEPDILRAPGTRAVEDGYAVTTSTTYTCINREIGKSLSVEELANQDQPFDGERDAAMFLMERILRRVEKITAANIFATGKWTTDLTPSTLWDVNTSDPLKDIEVGMDSVRSKIGRRPNTAIIGAAAWKSLRIHPDIVDRIKYTSRDAATVELVANLIGVPANRFFVGGTVENTANEGATATIADIWGKHMLLAYMSLQPSLHQPSGAYHFSWNLNNAVVATLRFDRRQDEERALKLVQSTYLDVAKLLVANAGYFLNAVVS